MQMSACNIGHMLHAGVRRHRYCERYTLLREGTLELSPGLRGQKQP